MKNTYCNNDEDDGQVYSYNSFAEDRVLRVRIQKSNKKEQTCLNCLNKIEPGEGSAYYSGLTGGQFYNHHVCLRCYEDSEGH